MFIEIFTGGEKQHTIILNTKAGWRKTENWAVFL